MARPECLRAGHRIDTMVARVSSPMFVGRRPELARVAAALEEARAGRPTVIVVAGEAGVGKTRFVTEAVNRARAAGARVLEGGCIQLGGEGLPFGPIVEALRTLPKQVPPAELDDLLGAGRADLGRLIPGLSIEFEPAARRVAEESARTRLFEHLLLLMNRLANHSPVVILLEDLHWADRSTLELLGFLVRNLRDGGIVLIGTYRTDEPRSHNPLRPFLAELERGGRAERLDLARFERSETATQLAAILGSEPDPDLLRQIHVRSDGNPFFAEELLATGTASGPLPETLREVLLSRIGALSHSAQTLLRVASAAGQLVSPAVLAAVTGTDERVVERRLREAVAEHILVAPSAPRRDQFAFRHALLREALYDDLLAAERIRLHSAFARTLAGAQDLGVDPAPPAELAYHWQGAHDLPRALEAFVRAGLAAEAMSAFAEAEGNFERALQLWVKSRTLPRRQALIGPTSWHTALTPQTARRQPGRWRTSPRRSRRWIPPLIRPERGRFEPPSGDTDGSCLTTWARSRQVAMPSVWFQPIHPPGREPSCWHVWRAALR